REITEFAAIIEVDEQHGGGAFERIADERGGGEPLVSGAQHVGGADAAGADRAKVLRAGEAGEDQPERDGAAEISDRERHRISGQQRWIDQSMHARLPASRSDAGTGVPPSRGEPGWSIRPDVKRI